MLHWISQKGGFSEGVGGGFSKLWDFFFLPTVRLFFSSQFFFERHFFLLQNENEKIFFLHSVRTFFSSQNCEEIFFFTILKKKFLHKIFFAILKKDCLTKCLLHFPEILFLGQETKYNCYISLFKTVQNILWRIFFSKM